MNVELTSPSAAGPQTIPRLLGMGFLVLLVVLVAAIILWLNGGLLTYTLDDPYIHLALAENIAAGHYGVNLSEVSAPSSSILWPFLLAPFATWSWFPLALNTVCAVATVLLFVEILGRAFRLENPRFQAWLVGGLTVALVLATNLVGLIFTGMEHSLQVLLATAVLLGVIRESETGRAPLWLWAAIVVGPLVRYENTAVSVAALGYLTLQGRYLGVFLATAAIASSIGSFMVFLSSLGLEPFPSSVIAKSSVVESQGAVDKLLEKVVISLTTPKALLLVGAAMGWLAFLLRTRPTPTQRNLAVMFLAAAGAHLLAGEYGWYHRYEIYIFAFQLLGGLFLAGPTLSRWLQGEASPDTQRRLRLGGIALFFLIGADYVIGLATVPLAAHNIYQQHYALHRLVTEYYTQPVAVNDLGYVSYQNDEYVLDLWGLASIEALRARKRETSPEWMHRLATKHNTKLAMIFDIWFPQVPSDWVRLGELHLDGPKITPADSRVSFYAINAEAQAEIIPSLKAWAKTLPTDTRFEFEEGAGEE